MWHRNRAPASSPTAPPGRPIDAYFRPGVRSDSVLYKHTPLMLHTMYGVTYHRQLESARKACSTGTQLSVAKGGTGYTITETYDTVCIAKAFGNVPK